MKKITFQILMVLAFVLSWQANAQTSDLYLSILDTGTCCNGEKWVSVSTGPDGTGTIIFAQGDGNYSNGSGHITDAMFTVDDGVTYYINAYDQYDDSWDGDTYEIRSAPAGGGFLVANNGGVSPDDGTDLDASFNWGDTQEQELEVSEAFSYTPPTCNPAVVDSSAVVPDCGMSEFSVEVLVSDAGDAGTVINDGATDYPVVAGTVIAGPYPTGSTVTLNIVQTDSECDFSLGDFSYDACPTIVDCSGSGLNETYCYDSDESVTFAYTSSDGNSALTLVFNQGTVEENTFSGGTYDDLVIYDGTDDTGTVLFDSDDDGGDLAGLSVIAASGNIFMTFDSDGSVSCASTDETSWDYDVACAACTPGEATATLIEDCDASTYTIEVVVTTAADATDITDGVTTLPFTGTQTFGPYDFGVDTTLDVVHADPTCDYTLGTYGLDACPPANDECADAINLTVNPDYACGTVTPGTVVGATDSGANDATCFGTPDDDVWFSFTATAEDHRVSLINFTSGTTDMYMTFYDASGGCGVLGDSIACSDPQTANLTGLTIGTTYFLQVYTWTATPGQTSTFDVCVGTAPSCLEPTSLTATNVTETSADLGWTEAGTATTWDIEWGTEGFTPTGTPNIDDTTNPHTLGGLTASTLYDFYVRADCGGGDTSAWAGPFTFATGDLPAACGGSFFDTGGPFLDYSADEDYTITICPDTSGDAVTATFNSFLVEGRGADNCWDWLYIYDGDDTSGTPITPSSLGLGAGTSGFCYESPTDGTADLVGQAIEASSASGCLTFRFTSDGSGQYEGWDATISCATLGTTDYNMNELFSYYPNPVTNTLNLKGHNTIDNVLIYNMLGQEVLRATPNGVTSELDMSGLQTGAYFVKVTVDGATKTIRVLKN